MINFITFRYDLDRLSARILTYFFDIARKNDNTVWFKWSKSGQNIHLLSEIELPADLFDLHHEELAEIRGTRIFFDQKDDIWLVLSQKNLNTIMRVMRWW